MEYRKGETEIPPRINIEAGYITLDGLIVLGVEMAFTIIEQPTGKYNYYYHTETFRARTSETSDDIKLRIQKRYYELSLLDMEAWKTLYTAIATSQDSWADWTPPIDE